LFKTNKLKKTGKKITFRKNIIADVSHTIRDLSLTFCFES